MIRPLRRLADWAVPPEALACIGRVRWCPVEPDRAHAVQTIAHRLNVPLSLLDYVVTDQGTWLRPWPSLEERMGMMLRDAFDRMADDLTARFALRGRDPAALVHLQMLTAERVRLEAAKPATWDGSVN